MELVLVRHGRPVRIETPRGVPADPELSEEGRAQAERVGAWLAGETIDRLYASPMRRAQETAAPLASRLGVTPSLEPGVTEFDDGASIYIPLEELVEHDPVRYRQLVETGWYVPLDPAVFRARVVDALESIIADNPGGRAVVVCHGGVINVWAGHLLGIARPLFFEPRYTSIHRFLCARSGLRSLASLNETAHLR